LYTVDISKEAIEFSMKAASEYMPWIKFINEDSSAFLKDFDKKIDFLYLDGFDSLPGQELDASKKQLDEIEKAFHLLSDKAIVLLDDADLPERGKTKFSSQFLLDHGFNLIIDEYQQLYVRGFKEKGFFEKILSKFNL
jgi:hypothetical protein